MFICVPYYLFAGKKGVIVIIIAFKVIYHYLIATLLCSMVASRGRSKSKSIIICSHILRLNHTAKVICLFICMFAISRKGFAG